MGGVGEQRAVQAADGGQRTTAEVGRVDQRPGGVGGRPAQAQQGEQGAGHRAVAEGVLQHLQGGVAGHADHRVGVGQVEHAVALAVDGHPGDLQPRLQRAVAEPEAGAQLADLQRGQVVDQVAAGRRDQGHRHLGNECGEAGRVGRVGRGSGRRRQRNAQHGGVGRQGDRAGVHPHVEPDLELSIGRRFEQQVQVDHVGVEQPGPERGALLAGAADLDVVADQPGQVGRPGGQGGGGVDDVDQPVERRLRVLEQPLERQCRNVGRLPAHAEQLEQVVGQPGQLLVAGRLGDQQVDDLLQQHAQGADQVGTDRCRVDHQVDRIAAAQVEVVDGDPHAGLDAQRRGVVDGDRDGGADLRHRNRGVGEADVHPHLQGSGGRAGDRLELAGDADQRQADGAVHLTHALAELAAVQHAGDADDVVLDGQVEVADLGVEQRVPARQAFIGRQQLVQQAQQGGPLHGVGDHLANGGQRVVEPAADQLAVVVGDADGGQQRGGLRIDPDAETHHIPPCQRCPPTGSACRSA